MRTHSGVIAAAVTYENVSGLTIEPEQTALVLSWTAPAVATGLTGYQIQYKAGGDTDWTNAESVTETTATISSLNEDTAYDVRVRATGSYGPGSWSSSSSTTFPVETRTVLAREMFTSDLDENNTGNLGTALTTGLFLGGGRLNGPRLFSGGNAVSAAVGRVTDAEIPTGYVRWASQWEPADFELDSFDHHEMSGWFRFRTDLGFPQGKAIFTFYDQYGNSFSLVIAQSEIAGNYLLLGPQAETFEVPSGTWIWISFGWKLNPGVSMDYICRIQVLGEETVSKMGSLLWWTSGPVSRVRFDCGGSAYQGSWAGRCGCVQLASFSDWSDVDHPPYDVAAPREMQQTYDLDPVSGDDDSPNGPWQTCDELASRLIDGTILDARITWKSADGEDRSYQQQPTSSEQEDWSEAWASAYEAGERIPQGDIVRLLAGEHRWTQSLLITGGVSIIGMAGSVVLLDRSLDAVWIRPDADNYPDVWRTDNPERYCQVFVGSGQSRSVLKYCNETDETTALTALQANEGSSWSVDADYLYVHAPGSVDPGTLILEHSHGVGGFGIGNGLIKNVRTIGAGLGGDSGLAAYANAAYHFGTGTDSAISILDGCSAEDGGKHMFANTGTRFDGLTVQLDCNASLNPQAQSDHFGFFSGSWSSYVDYSSGSAGDQIGDTSSDPPPRMVSIYKRCTATPLNRVPNQIQGGSDGGPNASYYAHNNGYGTQYALVLFEGCSGNMPSTPSDITNEPGSNALTLHSVVR